MPHGFFTKTFQGTALGGPGVKASIGSGLFGGTGGPAIRTPTFTFRDGVLTRTNSEFLDAQRQTLSDLRANRARFGEGFSEFRRARLQEVENARARTVGNLRSQLGRRGILGASFAGDAITRTELDFQQQADKVSADVDVAEFEFNLKNLAQESQIAQANLSRELEELGLSLQFVSNLNLFETRRFEALAELEEARFTSRRGGGRHGRSSSRFGPGGRLGTFGRSRGSFGGGGFTSGGTNFSSPGRTGPLTFGNTFQQPPAPVQQPGSII